MADYQKIELKSEEAPALAPDQEMPVEQEAPQEVEAPQAPTERPGWLPEKFESPEALAFAYKQLEQEFSKSKTEQPEEEVTPSTIDATTFDALSSEFNETGEVSEESRNRLAETGIPREFIDNYVEGQKKLADVAIQETYQSVGGEENYHAMVNWASTNLPSSDIDIFNDMVGGTREERMMAITSMQARFNQATASNTAPLMQGETSSTIAKGQTFQSRAQVTEAMSDPRYKKDPAYREEVYRRLQNSTAL